MPEMIEVVNPATGKSEWQTPLNARDLINHQGWEIKKTGSAPQIFREGESTNDELVDLIGNKRVKDNARVVDETGVSNTEHTNTTGALATGGDPDKIVKDEGKPDVQNNTTETDDDEDEDDTPPTDLGNGIVRDSDGELVDDALVTELKGKNKQALISYAKLKYNLTLDGRKNEDDLRLAIYDAAAESAK